MPRVASLHEEHLQPINRGSTLLTASFEEARLLGVVYKVHTKVLRRNRLVGKLRTLRDEWLHTERSRINQDAAL